jgi:hypothetical protein
MPSAESPFDTAAVSAAVLAFRRGLAEPALSAAARLEATLFARGAVGGLFRFEDAVARAWPGAVEKELVWSRQDLAGLNGLRLRAYDAQGRLLGQDCFDLDLQKPVAS